MITHIFVPDCTYLAEDAVFGVKQSLIADFRLVDNQARVAELGFQSPFWSAEWPMVMAPTHR